MSLSVVDPREWANTYGATLRKHVASCGGQRTILYLIIHHDQTEETHAVMLFLEGSGHGARQVFFDPSLASKEIVGYRKHWNFFTTTHVFCPPDQHPHVEGVDGGDDQESLQGLIEPGHGSLLSGRCTTVTLLVICCCLRFHCRDVQLLVDALRCVFRSIADEFRRDELLQGLCAWQCEMRTALGDRERLLRAMRLLHYEPHLSAAVQPTCGVFLEHDETNRERCRKPRAQTHVMCDRHWREIMHVDTTPARLRMVFELRPGGVYTEIPSHGQDVLTTDIQLWARNVANEHLAKASNASAIRYHGEEDVGQFRVRSLLFTNGATGRTLQTSGALCTMDATIDLGKLRGFLVTVLTRDGVQFAPLFADDPMAPPDVSDEAVRKAVEAAARLALASFRAQTMIERTQLHKDVYEAVSVVLRTQRVTFGSMIPHDSGAPWTPAPHECNWQLIGEYIDRGAPRRWWCPALAAGSRGRIWGPTRRASSASCRHWASCGIDGA